MPRSTNRRTTTATRRNAEPRGKPEVDEVDDVEDTATPSRKRRKVNSREAYETHSAQHTQNPRSAVHRRNTRSNETKAPEDDLNFNEDDVDSVIRNLATAKYKIAASEDHANELHQAKHPDGRTAYAKIAGNGWTFYVDSLQVRIGRPPDELALQDQQDGYHREPPMDNSLVHIDLGPNKQVSRQHAEIQFHEPSGRWHISINGRNGARLDDLLLARGDSAELRSGSVIDIAGTQMIFVMPNEAPEVHPIVSAQIKARRDDDDEDDEDDVDLMHPPSLPHRTPNRGGQRSIPQDRPTSTQRQSSNYVQAHNAYSNNPKQTSTGISSLSSGEIQRPSSQAEQKSPSYSRGLMLETTEDINYGADSAKDIKPPHSYAQLIGMAILSDPEEKLTLAKIYEWIKERYAFYRHSGAGWQNSIRHNLSLNKCFEKVARRTDEPGKGMKWQIVSDHRDEFVRRGLHRRPRGSSAPNSPQREMLSSNDGGWQSAEGFYPHDSTKGASKGLKFFKTSPGSTPPMAKYPMAKPTYTPEQGRKGYTQVPPMPDGSSPTKGYPANFSPYPFSSKSNGRANGLTDVAAAGSPGGPRFHLGSDNPEHVFTPVISKHDPKLAPPSTARLPSLYMPISSPAPFWKMTEFGNTNTPAPGKWGADSSPVKTEKEPEDLADEKKHVVGAAETREDQKFGDGRSSSPLLLETVGAESPSKPLMMRVEEKFPTQDALRSHGASQSMPERSDSAEPGLLGKSAAAAPIPTSAEEEDEEEGGMIDLTRGFQPIGSFHRSITANAGVIGRT